MINLKINGIPAEVEDGTTVLNAAKSVGVKIPTLCYHPDLTPFASCGMCICKQEGNKKIIRACSTPASEGMSIITNDAELFQVRKTILEMTLSTHPASCLTCIRNGNCELQTLAAEFGIREIPYAPNVSDAPIDDSSPSIILDPAKCIKCGRCVQVCQELQGVYALEFVNRGDKTTMSPAAHLKLNDSPCVKCGQCIVHCPVGAIHEVDETDKLRAAILDPTKQVCVQMAPATRVGISEEFDLPVGTVSTGKLYSSLRAIGCDKIFDTNFGADLTIMEEGSEFVKRLTTKGEVLPQFTSCCPAWVDYVEKYFPELNENLSSAKSPMMMQGAITKTYYAKASNIDPKDIYSVAIMPCTAKKFERGRDDNMKSSGYDDVDLVLTTRELARLFRAQGIDLSIMPDQEADNPIGEYTGAGTIFGVTGGVMEAAVRTAYKLVTGDELDKIEVSAVRGMESVRKGEVDIKGTKVRVALVHGLANAKAICQEVLDAKRAGEPAPYDFIEVMACRGGCIAGGGQPYGTTDEVRNERIAGLYSDDENSKLRKSHDNPSIKKIYCDYLDEPLSHKAHELLHTTYKKRKIYEA